MNFIFRLLGFLVLCVDAILGPIYWLRRRGRSRRIPPIDNQLFLLPATELAAKIRQRKLTALYVVATYIGRIKQVNPIVNAVSEERFDAALIEAKAVDDFLGKNKISEGELKRSKPFLGVPITVKESCGVKGMSYAVGSVKRRGMKCDVDSPSIQRLKDAGFIPIAVTNCPEYCVGLETNNLINGATKNPYNTFYTVGGSSGGEAALLSSAASVVGIGSDYAGSIRLPCMFTGLFGHKTTPRIIPRTMHFPNSTDPKSYDYFAIGPMTRYASDLKPILQILCDKEAFTELQLDKEVDLHHLKVLHTEDYDDLFGIERVSNAIVDCVHNARRYLRDNCGMSSQRVRFKDLADGCEIGTCLFLDHDDPPNFLEDPNDPKKTLNLYVEILKSIAGISNFSIFLLLTEFIIRHHAFIPISHLPFYKKKMERLKKDVWETLGDNAVLLYPTFPSSAFEHYRIFTKSYGISYSMIFNILGCAVTQVPISMDENGLPIGIQVIAGPKQDHLCLAVAEALEKGFGGWVPPN